MKKPNAGGPLIVLCPHYAPDTAPTGVVITRIVDELVARGHEVHVVTSLPWYRQHKVEDAWARRVWNTEQTSWGSIARVTPFAGKDKANIPRRALGFLGFSALLGVRGLFAGGVHRKASAVIAMSPPLTLGLTGWLVSVVRRAPLIFNIQDVFPDAAIATENLRMSVSSRCRVGSNVLVTEQVMRSWFFQTTFKKMCKRNWVRITTHVWSLLQISLMPTKFSLGHRKRSTEPCTLQTPNTW